MKINFHLIVWVIIFFGLFLKLAPLMDNNFHFTIDQGNDAVHAREIWYGHQLPLRGPETSIEGVYHGPLWFYFISIGYLLFGGHPAGAVILMIILYSLLTVIIIKFISEKTSKPVAILIGLALQLFWPYYELSRFSFNPFPLTFLAILLIFFLAFFSEGITKFFLLAAIPVGLVNHTEIASLPAFLFLYLSVGLWGIIKHSLSIKNVALGLFTLSLFYLPRVISEVESNFSQFRSLQKEIASPYGYFSQTQYLPITQKFLDISSQGLLPNHQLLSTIILCLLSSIFILSLFPKTGMLSRKLWNKNPKLNDFSKRFIIYSIILIGFSLIWFGSNVGHRPWHTAYIPTIIFISSLLIISNLKKYLSIPLLILILGSQSATFAKNYLYFLHPLGDPSLLNNEISTIDWIYRESKGRGFYTYIYTPSVYDYHYQYLFWWYGKNTYDYLPCEYSTFPDTPDFFVPNIKHYQEPKRDCQNERYLIIEPDQNIGLKNKWLDQVSDKTSLVNETTIGSIKIQKRIFNR